MCVVIMAFFRLVTVLLSMAMVALRADMQLECGLGSIVLTWKESQSKVDLFLLRLGDCSPTSVSAGQATFYVELSDCNFRRLVTGDQLVYMNDLIYSTSDANSAFTYPVACTYTRPDDWQPPMLNPVVFHTYGQEALRFQMEIMNDDFSAPASTTTFPLGSLIPIRAAVEQKSHQPLILFIQECVATTTPEPQMESEVYHLITNDGCLVDSKGTRSRFLPRRVTSELHLLLQSFKFADEEQVYIHCGMGVWDPSRVDNSKKACHYVSEYGWVLLDDPSRSKLCGCCDSSCKSRSRRSEASDEPFRRNAVFGPLTIKNVKSLTQEGISSGSQIRHQ